MNDVSESMVAIMFANGSYNDPEFYKRFLSRSRNAYIVAVDGGLNFLGSINKRPDLIIGDLDSVKEEYLVRYEAIETLRFPPEKDKTDTELALSTLIDRGFRVIVMLGMIGSRLDHTLSNIFLLKSSLADRAELLLVNEHNLFRTLKGPAKLNTEFGMGQTVSILPFSDEVKGLNVRGFKYPLSNFDMSMDNPGRGISNIVTQRIQTIYLESGTILIDCLTDPE